MRIAERYPWCTSVPPRGRIKLDWRTPNTELVTVPGVKKHESAELRRMVKVAKNKLTGKTVLSVCLSAFMLSAGSILGREYMRLHGTVDFIASLLHYFTFTKKSNYTKLDTITILPAWRYCS